MIKYYHFGLAILLLGLTACSASAPKVPGKRTIVVTYSVLGSLVQDLVGDQFDVAVPMPNGLDPHEWEPSAKDIETLNKASLVVANGLNLEGGMEGALTQAAATGVPVFTASDHILVRTVKEGQGLPTGDADQATGAQDPHLWLDPVRMGAVMKALAAELKSRFGTDLDARAADLVVRLGNLDSDLRAQVAAVPPDRRLLVTGHESLGYFAEAYGFTLVGAIIPSLSSRAEVSASDMASLKTALQGRKVAVIFTELGTPPKVAEALGTELNLGVVPITTHALAADGSYFTLLRNLVQEIVAPLGREPR